VRAESRIRRLEAATPATVCPCQADGEIALIEIVDAEGTPPALTLWERSQERCPLCGQLPRIRTVEVHLPAPQE